MCSVCRALQGWGTKRKEPPAEITLAGGYSGREICLSESTKFFMPFPLFLILRTNLLAK